MLDKYWVGHLRRFREELNPPRAREDGVRRGFKD